ncbi:MAG: hypothetical protein QOD74_35 [Variibacter sp.]|nr:hypothetical protein [Variibacter sp.]
MTLLPKNRRRLLDPAVVFVALSLVFGAIIIALTPPLRGPDEAAHFLRAYGVSSGEIIPRTADAQGRKGLFLPAHIARDFGFFEDARYEFKYGTRVGYRTHLAAWRARQAPLSGSADAPVFTTYSGSEGYTPVPYIPYVVAALIARALQLEFVPTMYLMRAAGLIAVTLVAAFAIFLAPRVGWAFVAIAMLPTAVYGRSVISADGLTLSATLAVLALCLAAALGEKTAPASRALWFALSSLCKPPQVAFVLLEAMTYDRRRGARWWLTAAAVAAAGILAIVLWTLIAGTDSGAWRMYPHASGGPEQFDPKWKLGFMVQNPLHFPLVVLGSLDFLPELGRQIIGVLGWLDARLRWWGYVVLPLLVAVTTLRPIEAAWPIRLRIAAVATLTAVAYILAVTIIFFLTYTPIESTRIEGIQGRYFIGILPLIAVTAACLLPRGLPDRVVATTAVFASVLSGVLVCDAILQSDWRD